VASVAPASLCVRILYWSRVRRTSGYLFANEWGAVVDLTWVLRLSHPGHVVDLAWILRLSHRGHVIELGCGCWYPWGCWGWLVALWEVLACLGNEATGWAVAGVVSVLAAVMARLREGDLLPLIRG
jgi:hypothetical protein